MHVESTRAWRDEDEATVHLQIESPFEAVGFAKRGWQAPAPVVLDALCVGRCVETSLRVPSEGESFALQIQVCCCDCGARCGLHRPHRSLLHLLPQTLRTLRAVLRHHHRVHARSCLHTMASWDGGVCEVVAVLEQNSTTSLMPERSSAYPF